MGNFTLDARFQQWQVPIPTEIHIFDLEYILG